MTKHMQKIEELFDDRKSGNGWFVYLKPGWKLNNEHCFSESTKSEVWRTMQDVETCDCEDCQEHLASGGKAWSDD